MNKYLAEFIGTFCLVFFGAGAIVVNDFSGGAIGHLGISFAFGLIVMAMIYAVGNISGAHLNPAVSIGFTLARGFPVKECSIYIFVQIVGAIAASLFLRYLFPVHETYGMTQPTLGMMPTFIVEVFLTFILMFVILNVSTGTQEKGIMAGVAIGVTVTLEALVGGPLTGASMNPARSIGPAISAGNLYALWIYILAPIVGVVIASPMCRLIQGETCCSSDQDVSNSN